eukprot:Rmarinus@m.10369
MPPKRSADELAPDAEQALKRVRSLREHTKKNLALASRTPEEVGIKELVRQVETLEADPVADRIESVVAECVKSILAGDGYKFNIPSRTEANQMYIEELDRIVLRDQTRERVFGSVQQVRKTALTTRIMQLVYELCMKNIHVTKRDLFYTDVKLFQKQDESDPVLDDVACLLGCTRSSLKVVASDKGVVVGRLRFEEDGDLIDCTKMGVGGKAISPFIDKVTNIEGDAEFILLVEKDAAFMRLAEDRFYNRYPCILITGKGQPDLATRMFLKKVKEHLKIPVLALVDSDPYGLKILSVYMHGSKNMAYDSANVTTTDIRWLGVLPSDLQKYKIPEQCRLKMTDADVKMGKELVESPFVKKNPRWVDELNLMLKTKEKAEIQALSAFGFQFLSEVYLPRKLKEGGWI